MKLPDGSPPRPENRGGYHDRVTNRYVEHACHLRISDLRKLVDMAVKDLSKATYSTVLREGFNGSKTKNVKRNSFDELLEVVMKESDGKARRLEVFTLRAQTPSGGRFVLLDISPAGTVIDVRGNPENPDDDDWAEGRANKLREQLLKGHRSKLCIRARARLQGVVGAAVGGGIGLLVAFLVALGHPLLLPAVWLGASGGAMGVLGGIASAYRARTMVWLTERLTFAGWIKMPTFDQSLVIAVGLIGIVVSITTFLLTPDPTSAPTTPVTNHAPARAGRR